MYIDGCRRICMLLAVIVFILPGISYAGMEEEISDLLLFVEQSGCTFNRNDKEYTGGEARQHIERKYNHVKSKVKTTDQFIEYAATRSSISGKPYTVQCGTMEMKSADWLHEELDKLRTR